MQSESLSVFLPRTAQGPLTCTKSGRAALCPSLPPLPVLLVSCMIPHTPSTRPCCWAALHCTASPADLFSTCNFGAGLSQVSYGYVVLSREEQVILLIQVSTEGSAMWGSYQQCPVLLVLHYSDLSPTFPIAALEHFTG